MDWRFCVRVSYQVEMPLFRAKVILLFLIPALALGGGGCKGSTSGAKTPDQGLASTPPCPAEAPAPPVLPLSSPIHSLADFWIERTEDATEVLLDSQQIAAHNQKIMALKTDTGWPGGRWDLLKLRLSPLQIKGHLEERLQKLRQAVDQGRRVLKTGARPEKLLSSLQQGLRQLRPADEIRVAHRSTPLRCYATVDPAYEKAWDLPFDLLQCAQLRLGEPVRVLAKGKRLWYVWSSYTEGWVDPGALTSPIEGDQAAAYIHPRKAVVPLRDSLALWSVGQRRRLRGALRMGIPLPLRAEGGPGTGGLLVTVPTPAGLDTGWIAKEDGARVGYPLFSREALLRFGFGLLNTTYGWGGSGGHRDCSRLMMDLFGAFGILLPRNSWRQSQAGTRRVDVGQLDEAAKIAAIEEAARAGVVLLYLKGHIMLYLGRDGDHLYALHQFSGYLKPCPRGGETMMRVNRAVVSTLDLGRGSSRRSFIERVERLVIFAPPPPSSGDTPDSGPAR